MTIEEILSYQRVLSIIYNDLGKDKLLEVIETMKRCDEQSYQVFLKVQEEARDQRIFNYMICENEDGTSRIVLDR